MPLVTQLPSITCRFEPIGDKKENRLKETESSGLEDFLRPAQRWPLDR